MAKEGTLTALPKLRFPEFREAPEWTLGKASDIVDVLQGYGFPEKFQGGKEGEFPFYKVSDISTCVDAGGVFLTDANNHIDSNTMVELRARPMPVAATVFAKIGEAIRSNKRAITTRPCLVDNNAAGVKAITGLAQDRFVYYLWCQVPLIEYAGGVVPAVNKSAIEQILVSYPQPDEQQKIADCLTSLDEMITVQGRKVEALKAHKRGLMQQLFPREGETRPRLRFSEFRDAPEWESFGLADICSVQRGKFSHRPRNDPKFFGGPYAFIQTGDVVRANGGAVVASQSLNKLGLSVSKLFKPTIVLITIAANIGDTALLEADACFTDSVVGLIPKANCVTPRFLESTMRLKKEHLNQVATTGAQKNINNEILEALDVLVPSINEQIQIDGCLSSLDTQITAESRQLAALKTHKQGLMQQLFPVPETTGA